MSPSAPIDQTIVERGSSAQESTATASANAGRVLYAAAYAVLGATLAWSRLAGLGHSFWTDEILMVDTYVRAGAGFILTGETINHELMALLSWVLASFAGESEIAHRLLSVIPFLAGVALVTAWLHVRHGRLAGVLFLFLATVSPLLLDITRQARGYGLAFLAMSVVVVAALEAVRTGRTAPVAVMCVAGVLGAWTLPQLALAFAATGTVLVLDRRTRTAAAAGLVISLATIAGLYAPHIGAIRDAARIPDGVQIGFPWVVTAGIDQIVLPALIWIDGTALAAGLLWLPAIALVVLVAASSPLLHDWRTGLVLCSGIVVTVVALWLRDAYVIPRYLSFLLVPWFVILSTGAASVLGRLRTRPAPLRTLACCVVLVVLAARFLVVAPDVVALPREANRDAAEVVRAGAPGTPVLAYMRNPQNLPFYLDRGVEALQPRTVANRVCGAPVPVFYVFQDFALEPVTVPCLDRAGVVRHRFEQYARGTMYVWWIPPRS